MPVSVPGLPGTYDIVGQLCLPAGTPPQAVQVLVPGATYDASYWDFPAAGYSYQRYAQSAGQPTSFAGSPSYTAYVLPGAGHDLNLAVNHDQFFAALSGWASAHAG